MISIKTNAQEVVVKLDKLTKNLTNFDPALKRSGEFMVSSIQRNFLAQGRPNAWAPLSPMTIANRRKGKGTGSPMILRDTGALFRSITYSPPTNNEVKIGTNMIYARKLQYGGTNVMPAHTETVKSFYRVRAGKREKVEGFQRKVPAKSFTVPPRPFVIIQSDDVPVLQDIFVQFVSEMKKRALEGGSV